MPHLSSSPIARRIAALAALLAVVLAAMWLNPPAPAGRSSSTLSAALVFEGERGAESSAILANLYPKNPATRYARIAPTADGFAPPDMQSGLNTPGSRWKNPAKTVQPVFPRTFNNPVRVRSGAADVSAVPIHANPDSLAQLAPDGSLTYPNAFGPGIDVVYRCEALKTEEFIVIREVSKSISSRRDELKIAQRFNAGSDAEMDSKVPKGRLNLPRDADEESAIPSGHSEINAPVPSTEVLGYSQSVPSGRNVGGSFASNKTEQTLHATNDGARSAQYRKPETRSPNLSFSWQLQTHGFKPRLTPANTIELCDDKGVPRLRINAPEGKDASGKLLRGGKELCITLEGNRVTLAADTKGLEFPIVIDPTWSSTGAMAQKRYGHNAATLQDGRILVAGGEIAISSGAYTSSCEIYDPNTAIWQATGNLGDARTHFTLNVLSDGRVIAVGGDGVIGRVATCEIYDLVQGVWSYAASLGQGRTSHTSTLLNNGKLLVVGGAESTATAGCELYDPIADQWAGTNSLATARVLPTSILLGDGKVIVTGGSPATGGLLQSCERFDPTTETWSGGAQMADSRSYHSATLLPSGNVLIIGGIGPSTYRSSCEIYDSTLDMWSAVDPIPSTRSYHSAVLLNSRFVLVVAGTDDSGLTNQCHLFDLTSKKWSSSSAIAQPRMYHTLTKLAGGNLLLAGGYNFNNSELLSSCEVFDVRPQSSAISISGHWGTLLPITLSSDSLAASASYSIASQPQHGTLSGTPPDVSYTASTGFVGTDTFTYTATDSFGTGPQGTVTVDVTNTKPALQSVSSSTTPANSTYLPGNQPATPNQVISFSVTASDPDGDPLTYTWDFGDGTPLSNEQSPTHAYPEVGTYLAKIIVTDPAGAVAGDLFPGYAGNVIQVLVSKPPVTRLQTSDVVAFATQPFTFDASTSTDPENAIATYDWDFGDGTPHGSGQIISKVYDQPGAYTISLTITDSAGVISTLTRVIEVLGASEAGLYNGFMNYKVSWNRKADSKDSLSFAASVNVGDDIIGAGTPVAIEIVGQRFTGTLDGKLRDYSNASEKWQVKANLRHQPHGTVSLKVTIKKTSIGSAFNLAGVTAGGDPHDIVSKDVTAHLEIGAHSFELQVPSDFKFSGDGTRAKGDGVSE